MMTELLPELKAKIVSTLNLRSVSADAIADDSPLIGEGLGLDSIDVLELVVMLERDYGVKIENREVGKRAFSTVRSLAEFIVQASSDRKQ